MKKASVLTAIFCLLLAATSVFAQEKTTNFAGDWELDVAKSKLGERVRVESMTMTVAQTDKELKVTTATKRAARPEGEAPNIGSGGGGARQGGGMGRGGMMGGGNGTMTYSRDGKETSVETEAPVGMPSAPTTLKAKFEKDGKLRLTSSRTVSSQMGEFTMTVKDTWELADAGKTLKVTREMDTPRGAIVSEMYFTKKDSSKVSDKDLKDFQRGAVKAPADPSLSGEIKTTTDPSLSGTNTTTKEISVGVVNGKAIQLAKPAYPAEAREAKAGGAVNVQVTIDEQGNVISAKAVSGDALLRAASEEAARNSKFAPTMFQGAPIKVTGIIVYNFVP